MKLNFFLVRACCYWHNRMYMIRAMYTIYLFYFRVSYGSRGKFSGLLAHIRVFRDRFFRTVEKKSLGLKKNRRNLRRL